MDLFHHWFSSRNMSFADFSIGLLCFFSLTCSYLLFVCVAIVYSTVWGWSLYFEDDVL